MARIIDTQTNQWGRYQGADPQRSDLWVVDFTQALKGIKAVLNSTGQMSTGLAIPYVPPTLASYYAYSVALPDLKVKPDTFRRDARAYQMPSWDEPCDTVRMTFLLDCHRFNAPNLSPYRSDIYQMLDTWRACVRAGRGSLSNEYAMTLDGNYRIDYAFDIQLSLLTGTIPAVSAVRGIATANANPSIFGTGIGGLIAGINNAASAGQAALLNGDLIVSMQYRLANCWLASFRLSELSYEGTKLVQLDTIFYSEDIQQSPQPTG